jgi:hypothetical protein
MKQVKRGTDAKRTHDGVKKRCGCSKRQWPKCSHPWWFSFFYRGTEHRYSLDKIASARNEPAPTSKADAIEWRDRLRNEIRFDTLTQLTPPPAEPTRLTFGDVCEEYLKRYVCVPTPHARGRISARAYRCGALDGLPTRRTAVAGVAANSKR